MKLVIDLSPVDLIITYFVAQLGIIASYRRPQRNVCSL